MIRFEGVERRFGPRQVLCGVSFEVRPGELLGLIGASGSGKSTLARLAVALERPDGGRISLPGASLGPETDFEGAGATAWRRRVGFVSQHVALWPGKTALQQVTEGLTQVRGVPRSQAESVARDWACRFEVVDQLSQYPHTLSGGQRQRIGLVRALVLEPEFLVLDEITTGLDPELTAKLSDQLLRARHDTPLGILLVTHQIEFLRHHGDRAVFLHDGTVAESGTVSDVLSSPSSPRLKEFLQSVRRSW